MVFFCLLIFNSHNGSSCFWCLFFIYVHYFPHSWHWRCLSGYYLSSCYFLVCLQNCADARKALSKNGTQINGVLIVGVKLVDPTQRQALDERASSQGFMTLHASSSGLNSEQMPSQTTSRPYYLQNGSNAAKQSSAIASPAKSVVSRVMDLMFGV